MKTLKILFIVALIMIPTLIWALPPTANKVVQVKIESLRLNIDRVFMHLPGDYSVAYTGQDKTITIERLIRSDQGVGRIAEWLKERNTSWMSPDLTQTLIADVSHGEPMFIEVKGSKSTFTIFIHIHSAKEIGGGEWSHLDSNDNTVSYQTSVVE